MVEYKVVIPSAGIGSRLSGRCDHINKTLVPVANKPIIAYIIDKFDPKIEIVIALGYKGDLIRQFLKLAYPERKFTFIDIDPYDGPNSGLGYTLLSCKHELQCPFIFFTNDAIVQEDIPLPDYNWLGYSHTPAGTDYRSVVLDPWDRDIAKGLCEKGANTENGAYVGICGIKDYEYFWQLMEHEDARRLGESYALGKMMDRSIKAKKFTWLDTGTTEAMEFANNTLKSDGDPVILPKVNECIWFCNNKVIKFSTDARSVGRKVTRATFLKGYVPTIVDSTDNMFCYNRVDGEIMSKAITPIMFRRFLVWLEPLWESRPAIPEFEHKCLQFYKEKTKQRIDDYFRRFGYKDEEQIINDVRVPTTYCMLNNIDWKNVVIGSPTRFHGDLHFENILCTPATDEFCLLDWREDFAGSLVVGDIYYDFAKLLHGFIISHELINKNLYEITTQSDNLIKFDFLRKHSSLQLEADLRHYVMEKGYDWKKVKILTALIYLNIAALHHEPYCHLLFVLGKLLLHEETTE